MTNRNEIRFTVYNAQGCDIGSNLTIEDVVHMLKTTTLYRGDKFVVEAGMDQQEERA